MKRLERLLKIEHVAELLSVCRRTVHRIIARGELVVVKVGRSTRIPEESVIAYLERSKREVKR